MAREEQTLILQDEVEDAISKSFQKVGCDDTDISNLLTILATPPAYTTLRMNALQADREVILEHVQREITKMYRERGKDNPVIYTHPVVKEVIIIENRGPNYHLVKLDKEVIVDLACGMAVLRGADIFVQGIMGAPSGMQIGEKVSVYSDIDGQCRRGLVKPFDGKKIFVGNGIAQISRETLFCSDDNLRGVGILMTEPLYEAPSLTDICPQLVFPQNLPSVVCGLVLNPLPGEVIIDMCASPGGKTTHIATLMKNTGRLIALDKTPQKIEKIQKNSENWKLTCIEPYVYDAIKCIDENSDMIGGPPYPPESFDRVLLDGPCSALGQRPYLRNKMSHKTLQSYPTYQRKIFNQAVNLLKPGGVLVYSTCTITLEENEKQVAWALKTFNNLRLDSQVPHIGGFGRPFDELSHDDVNKLQYFNPSLQNKTVDEDTIGFFIAKFVKNENR